MPKSIAEYAAEREGKSHANQVPSAGYVPPGNPSAASTYANSNNGFGKTVANAKDNSFLGAMRDQYSRGNNFAGVKPSDEIAGEYFRGNYGRGTYNLLIGKPGWTAARNLLQGPKGSYMGGSKEALEANRQQYDQGILSGQDQNARGEGIAMAGADTLQQGAGMAGGAYDAGMGLSAMGTGIGLGSLGQQSGYLGSSLDAARTDVGSQALAQQQMANDANAKRMMAQAASARGGNAAAAMRNAQAQASANQLDTNQQLALLRMKEAESKRDAQIQANQYAAGQMGQNAQMGFSTASAGLGAANSATGNVLQAGSGIGSIGGQIMGSGTQNTSTFVNAELEQNKAQLEADQKLQEAKAKHRAGIIGAISKGIGSMAGGGGGGFMSGIGG